MNVLNGLKPQKVFEFFEYISSVPRGSGNTEQVSELCVKFAKERGLACIKDKLNNIIIYKPATPGYENSPTVVIQGHLDMVCAKTSDCTKDMATEPIELMHDDKYVFAKDTTLGGDDGIAVAYALAVLDSNEIKHPPIEAVFTVDEETGMDGANGLTPTLITGRRLLNIDSEEEGIFTCGCAGGCRVNCSIPITMEEIEDFSNPDLTYVTVAYSGFRGGHSGTEIGKQPASAISALGRALYDLIEQIPFKLIRLDGGKFDNVIADNASALIEMDSSLFIDALRYLRTSDQKLKDEYLCVNPDMTMTVSKQSEELLDKTYGNDYKSMKRLDDVSTSKVLTTLFMIHQGVIEMSMDLKDMVQTSQNIGIVKIDEDSFKMSILVRSSIESQKTDAIKKIRICVEMMDGSVELKGNYPGWKFENESALRELCISSFKHVYGKDPLVNIIHAGLECGLFVDKLGGLDAISFGPNILDIHTPKERLDIASVERVWRMLLDILEKMC